MVRPPCSTRFAALMLAAPSLEQSARPGAMRIPRYSAGCSMNIGPPR